MILDQISDTLVREEGERLAAYQDHLGYWTIGVGRLIDGRKGGGITRAESRYLLANDIRRAEAEAARYPWFAQLNDARQNVVVCMIFQLGVAGFAQFKQTHAAIASGAYELAADRMLRSRWAEQTPARAERMATIMGTGVWE